MKKIGINANNDSKVNDVNSKTNILSKKIGKKSKSGSVNKNSDSDNFINSEFSENIYHNFNSYYDEDDEEIIEKCLCCNWKFPSYLNKHQINNHINLCLDGNGPDNIRTLLNQ